MADPTPGPATAPAAATGGADDLLSTLRRIRHLAAMPFPSTADTLREIDALAAGAAAPVSPPPTGAALPTVEELASALWDEDVPGRITWARFVASPHPADQRQVVNYRARAAAVLARLAQPGAIRAEVGAARADGGAVREAVLSPREIAQEIVLDVLADEHQDRVATFASYRPEIDRAEALIRAALAAPGAEGPAGDGWRPIETAPKDGTDFLAFFPQREFWAEITRVSHWRVEEEPEDQTWEHASGARQPTHWRPLPAPPAAQPREDRT